MTVDAEGVASRGCIPAGGAPSADDLPVRLRAGAMPGVAGYVLKIGGSTESRTIPIFSGSAGIISSYTVVNGIDDGLFEVVMILMMQRVY